MPRQSILSIGHRELILSSPKKPHFAFLRLPEELQDQVIDSLDRNKLTLKQASDMVAGQGVKLSYNAIAAYYEALRWRRAELLVKTSGV